MRLQRGRRARQRPGAAGFRIGGHRRPFQKRTDDALDPAVRLQFDLSEDVMLYAGWSRGSKAGGMKANDQNIGTYTLNACADPAWCRRYAGRDSLSPAELAAGVTLQDGNATYDYEDETAESFEVGAKVTLLDGRANLNLARNTGIVAVDPWSGGRQ